jgi:hypothetical protein
MPENMSDRMPDDLPVTKCINVMVGITRSKVILLDAPLEILQVDVGFAFGACREETARVMKQCQNLVESRQVQEQVWGWLGISTGS